MLTAIAVELTQVVNRNTTIDWSLRTSVQAKLRSLVKRALKTHGNPPDEAKRAAKPGAKVELLGILTGSKRKQTVG